MSTTLLVGNVLVRDGLGAQLHVILVMSWALALGLAIGFERRRSGKPAGPRTHALVAMAAALVTYVGAAVIGEGTMGDPTRGLHAIITGIGFLGAGAILTPKKSGHMVVGLTTAASVMWSAAAGGAVALGYGVAATGGTLVILAVLLSIGYFKRQGEDNDDD